MIAKDSKAKIDFYPEGLFQINQNRFLICGGEVVSISISNRERTLIEGKISIYNAITDEIENLQIDNLNHKRYYIYPNSIAFDRSNNKLYLSGSAFNPERVVYHLAHLKSIDMNESTSLRVKDEINMKYYGHPYVVCIHQVVHLFVRSIDYQNVAHLKWNINTKQWNEVHEFIGYLRSTSTVRQIIHLPKKDKIIMVISRGNIGGKSIYFTSTHIWCFDVSQAIAKWERKLVIDEGYRGSLQIVATSDENYLILLFTQQQCFDILDMRDHKKYRLRKCSIVLKIHEYDNSLMAITGGIQDSILIHGWVKSLFKKKKFSSLTMPPWYLVQIIETYYNQETVHVIQAQKVHHLINLKTVLSFME